MSQCQCQAIDSTFDRDIAEEDLERFQRRGPQKTTRMLLEALEALGVRGRSVLEIGGGVGVVQHALLEAGATEVTSVDASSAYLAACRAEAKRRGHEGKVRYFFGDFVTLAPAVPSADIVTLDRVICCYDEMEALVGVSSTKALKIYALVYPRGAWWVRLGIALMNLEHAIRRNPFRIFYHSPAAVEDILRAQGLSRVSHRRAGYWQVAVFARAS